MKNDGLLRGYPDGFIYHPKPTTRYDIAVSLHATYLFIKKTYDELDSSIKKLSSGLDGQVDKADLKKPREELKALQDDIAGMKAWGNDIRNLLRLTEIFRDDVKALGVDYDAMHKDLSDIFGDRDLVDPVEWGYRLDLIALGTHHNSLSLEGRPAALPGRTNDLGLLGIDSNLSIFHQSTFYMTTNNINGPTVSAMLGLSNMIDPDRTSSTEFANQGRTSTAPFRQACESLAIERLAAEFQTKLFGEYGNATIGRTGAQFGSYLFKRPDTTPYYSNEVWDDGDWTFDGAAFKVHYGWICGTAIVGQANTSTSLLYDSRVIQSLLVGRKGSPWDASSRPLGLNDANQVLMRVDNLGGVQIGARVAPDLKANLTYLVFGANKDNVMLPDACNRLTVYGADATLDRDRLTLAGGYSASTLGRNEHNIVDKDNAAWHIEGSYKVPLLDTTLGYKEIGANFTAPGDWGRIGMWWNPVDIKGWNASVRFSPSEKATLRCGGEWYSGINDSSSSWGSAQKVDRYTTDFEYKLSDPLAAKIGYEWIRYSPGQGLRQPQEIWLTLGLNYEMGSHYAFSAMWQLNDYDSKGVSPFTIGGREKHSGGLFATQLTYKFSTKIWRM
jgi:hypothetical protein